MTEANLRRELVRYSHAMHAAGWVANHDGNLSARIGEDRFVCTPTAFSKAAVGLDDLLVVDATGQRLAGAHKPFSELSLHLAVFAARPNVGAVMHAHPPHATAWGVSGQGLPHPFLPEAVVSLGAEIPTVPPTAPGKPAVEALRPTLRRCDAVLLAGNGVLTWGPDLETAYLRLELVEHLARIAALAAPLGGVRRLPEALVADLVGKRAKAGLAAPEEVRAARAAPTEAPALEATVRQATERALAGIPNADAAVVARLVREALDRLA